MTDKIEDLEQLRALVDARRAEEEKRRSIKDDPAKHDRQGPSANIRSIEILNELYAGLIFADLYKDKFSFNKTESRWYVFNGHSWEKDISGAAIAAVEGVVEVLLGQLADLGKQIAEQAALENDTEVAKLKRIQKEALRTVKRLRTERGRQAALSFAHTNAYNQVSSVSEQYDSDPWRRGVSNGVIDLRTGQRRDGKPSDYISRPAPTPFLGLDTPCPEFENFLQVITCNDLALQKYLQRVFGYCLIGKVLEHVFFVFEGPGRNGKTVLMEVIRFVLGELFITIPPEMLLDQGRVRNSAGPSPDTLSLKARLIAAASESEESSKYAPASIKRNSGGDTLVARGPHDREPTCFEPSHTLFLLVNSKPSAPAHDFAFWARMALVPFRMKFVTREPQGANERRADKGILDKLKAEAPGILAWMVRGCLEYQQLQDLAPPACVKEATADYQRGEDILADWLDACCWVDPSVESSAKSLYQSFND